MKKLITVLLLFFMVFLHGKPAFSQCSICTKTAQQMGDKPAKGLNLSIIYLAFTPLALIGFLGYRWYKQKED